jgi:hypothetical protein
MQKSASKISKVGALTIYRSDLLYNLPEVPQGASVLVPALIKMVPPCRCIKATSSALSAYKAGHCAQIFIHAHSSHPWPSTQHLMSSHQSLGCKTLSGPSRFLAHCYDILYLILFHDVSRSHLFLTRSWNIFSSRPGFHATRDSFARENRWNLFMAITLLCLCMNALALVAHISVVVYASC